MLFSFNDEFIADIAGGLNDDDTLELLASGIEEMISEVETDLERTLGYPKQVTLEDGLLVVDLSATEEAQEFGAPGVMMSSPIRSAFIQSAQSAKRAFDKVVNDRG